MEALAGPAGLSLGKDRARHNRFVGWDCVWAVGELAGVMTYLSS